MASDDEAQVSEPSELYGLDPGEFVAARDALAKRLRAGGERERAAEIKRLRRPSAPAAAINRAARSDPDLASAVIAAGERLGEAQAKAIDDGDASSLREAMRGESEAVEAFVAAVEVEGVLAAAMVDRARDTVRAAGRSAELRDPFLEGRLSADTEAIGLGGELASADPPRRGGSRAGASKQGRGPKATKRPARVKQGAEPSAAELRKADRRITRVEKAVEKHEAKLAEAGDLLDEAERAAESATREAERARQAAASAEKAREGAERDRERASERVEQAEGRLADARAELEAGREARGGSGDAK